MRDSENHANLIFYRDPGAAGYSVAIKAKINLDGPTFRAYFHSKIKHSNY